MSHILPALDGDGRKSPQFIYTTIRNNIDVNVYIDDSVKDEVAMMVLQYRVNITSITTSPELELPMGEVQEKINFITANSRLIPEAYLQNVDIYCNRDSFFCLKL